MTERELKIYKKSDLVIDELIEELNHLNFYDMDKFFQLTRQIEELQKDFLRETITNCEGGADCEEN